MSQLPLRVFGLGVDIAHIPRFARTLERHGERFLKKAYHPTEIEEFYAREPSQRAVFLASRSVSMVVVELFSMCCGRFMIWFLNWPCRIIPIDGP